MSLEGALGPGSLCLSPCGSKSSESQPKPSSQTQQAGHTWAKKAGAWAETWAWKGGCFRKSPKALASARDRQVELDLSAPPAAGGVTPWPMWEGTANLPEPGALRVSAPPLPASGGRRPFRGRAPAGPAGPVSCLPGTAPALPSLQPLRFSLGLPGSLLPLDAAPGSRSAKCRRRLGAEGWAADLLAQGGTMPLVQPARRESFPGSSITETQPGWQEKLP